MYLGKLITLDNLKTLVFDIKSRLVGKVDKVAGKQLSTEDFTSADKTKLAGLSNYDDSEVKSQIALNRNTLGYQRKNIFDISLWWERLGDIKVYGGTITKNGNKITITPTGTPCYTSKYDASGTSEGLHINVQPLTQYTLSFQSNNNLSGTVSTFLNGNILAERVAYNQGSKSVTFKTLSDTTFLTFRISNQGGIGNSITFSDIMIRPAEITDDSYEPYKPSVEERLATLEAKLT